MQQQRSIWSVFASVAAVGALVIATIALVRSDGNKGGGAVTAEAGGAPTELTVNASEFKFNPDALNAAPGPVRLDLHNAGAIQHTLALKDTNKTTPLVDPGKMETLDLGSLTAGTYTLICTIPGHEAAGMKATLVVGTSSALANPSNAVNYQSIDDETDKSVKDFLANAAKPLTEGQGAQVMAPKVLPDGTKEFDLTAKVIQWEYAPGKKTEAYSYNGVVPGPTIKVDSGDKLKIVLKNELPESTSIHWHGIVTPNDQDGVPSVTQPPVKPGETYTYQFTAVGPAVGMYHAHQDSQKQVPLGLEGAFLIGEEPLPAGVKVAQEIPMILNDYGTMSFSINGKQFPATTPIVANKNDYILVHFMNEGYQIHPMHMHGFAGKIIATDGNPDPAPTTWDTILVAPGQRISVLVKLDNPGTWLFHCHILNHAESEHGYFGMATAIVVKP
ncbi:MAG TPA: multicopper oxidase domain-containing protein [Acidimicrobiia bacterium]|nr:multicopper oxidase domain-containing protein [Acidimicrobiia bacterium]